MEEQSIKLLIDYYNEIKNQNIVVKEFLIKSECPFVFYISIFNLIFTTLLIGFLDNFKNLLPLFIVIGINLILILISCLVPQKIFFKFDFENDSLIIKKLGFLSCCKCGKLSYNMSKIKTFKTKIEKVYTKKYLHLILETNEVEDINLMTGQIICKKEEEINTISKILNLILNKNNIDNNNNNKIY